jgi:putative ABC transport system permease protein
MDPTTAVIIGGDRSDKAMILGVDPEKVVNDWLVFGNSLRENETESALIGDSLATTLFEDVFSQSIRVFDSSPSPYGIGGVCVDPLNNGKVVYLPIETLQRDVNQQGINIVLLQVDFDENPQVFAQIEDLVLDQNLVAVELDSVVGKHVSFLGSIWSLVMFLPLFSLGTAAISLLSYLMLSVSGQQHEFGVMRALGAKPRNIVKIVLSQAFMVLLVSGVVGVFVGLLVTFWFLIPQPVITQTALVTLSVDLVVVLVFLGLFSVYPALKATKKSVVEAISEP